MGSWSHPLRPRSIRGQLIVLIAALAIPLIALQVWWGVREYRDAARTAEYEALLLADATASSVRQFVTLAEGVLQSLSEQFGPAWVAGDPCQAGIRNAVDALPFFSNVIAIRIDGSVLCSGLPVPDATDPGTWSWLPELRESGETTVGSPIFGTISDTWVLPIAVPIRDDEGTAVGAVSGSLPLLELGPFLGGDAIGEDQLVTIATADRVIIARSREAMAWIGNPLPPLSGSDREIAPGRWIATGPDLLGVQRAWGQVETIHGWIVYVGVPAEAVFGPARAAALRRIGITLLILVVGVLLAGGAYRRIASALHELAGMRYSTGGEPIPLPEATPDEVTEVVEHFNEILGSRAQAEAAEREARERYQSIFDNAVFGLYVSTLDGRFLQANASLAAMLGYESTEALVAAGPTALYPARRQREELIAAAADVGEIEDWEIDWLRSDGLPITVRLNGRIIDGPDGQPAFEMIVEDITEQKRTEGELRQTQKMEAIGKLAGGIAHDFNNLLTVIGGNLELVEDGLPPDHPVRADLDQIREAAGRASTLTTQLLAFARREPRGARRVEVNDVLTDMDRLLTRLIGEDVTLETILSQDSSAISIDPGELEQIVMNLVLNARDAMPMGGRIVIETREAPIDLGPGGSSSERGVLLSVRDTGVGMDYETSKRIFEPFYTTKPMGQGTGLGLSTVYGIVQRANGHIGVESEPGYGTTIDIWFPLAGEETVEPPAPEVSPIRSGGSERILVVEDEELVRNFVRRALKDVGYDIVVAEDGQEALELLSSLAEPVDLVLTDVVMPRMKGTELADRIPEVAPETPVLFMSGYIQNQGLTARLAADPDVLLRKPFSASELCTRVRRALDRAYAHQHHA